MFFKPKSHEKYISFIMTASLAAELKALADLKADGTLTPEQFERAKEAVLAGDAIPDGPADGDDDEPPGTSANARKASLRSTGAAVDQSA